jgi:hypothetical protein
MKGTDGVMKLVLRFALFSAFCLVLLAAAPEEKLPKPQYDAKAICCVRQITAIGSFSQRVTE